MIAWYWGGNVVLGSIAVALNIAMLVLGEFRLLAIIDVAGAAFCSAMILTLLVEMVMGRDISMSVKEAALKVGFVFLMMLMVFVLFNDIARRITPG